MPRDKPTTPADGGQSWQVPNKVNACGGCMCAEIRKAPGLDRRTWCALQSLHGRRRAWNKHLTDHSTSNSPAGIKRHSDSWMGYAGCWTSRLLEAFSPLEICQRDQLTAVLHKRRHILNWEDMISWVNLSLVKCAKDFQCFATQRYSPNRNPCYCVSRKSCFATMLNYEKHDKSNFNLSKIENDYNFLFFFIIYSFYSYSNCMSTIVKIFHIQRKDV